MVQPGDVQRLAIKTFYACEMLEGFVIELENLVSQAEHDSREGYFQEDSLILRDIAASLNVYGQILDELRGKACMHAAKGVEIYEPLKPLIPVGGNTEEVDYDDIPF